MKSIPVPDEVFPILPEADGTIRLPGEPTTVYRLLLYADDKLLTDFLVVAPSQMKIVVGRYDNVT
jgi:hypothetical protein